MYEYNDTANIYVKTMTLRWLATGSQPPRLQQMWQGDDGSVQWEDIEVFQAVEDEETDEDGPE